MFKLNHVFNIDWSATEISKRNWLKMYVYHSIKHNYMCNIRYDIMQYLYHIFFDKVLSAPTGIGIKYRESISCMSVCIFCNISVCSCLFIWIQCEVNNHAARPNQNITFYQPRNPHCKSQNGSKNVNPYTSIKTSSYLRRNWFILGRHSRDIIDMSRNNKRIILPNNHSPQVFDPTPLIIVYDNYTSYGYTSKQHTVWKYRIPKNKYFYTWGICY